MNDRELDALVAEKIIGVVVSNKKDHSHCWQVYNGKDYGMLPYYSSDITDAWDVFEKLGGLCGVGYGPVRKDWTAYFQINIDHPTHRASDKSAARAICLAALMAVGVEVAT